MSDLFASVPTLLLATLVGYLLGALPLADRMSRQYGVDIFAVGSGLAGSSNVSKTVGRVPGALVFLGDVSKGILAVAIADLIGVESPWVILPAGASVAGHWSSVFTRFRGGDGLATLGGIILGAFPLIGSVAIVVAGMVALGGQKMPYTSLLSIVFGYSTLVALSIAYDVDTLLALGIGGVSGLVLARALLGHRRRRQEEWEGLGEANGVTQTPGRQ